ncbi:hypothetical protein BjapCC829_50295 (plasmid) [Bradyrhizobium barranii]|uniref:Acyl-homoserine-lactone synthase n=1 Tax=Bradyrhizobium barranii TaxID=2992140 RepID=A0ABY3R2N9_9BRAD|nr:acyl-homoserine-lactone synthase [Bradyrhizobium japonicum]UFW92213.1 hypothetical protein BjapCC829_50295 [Bradyrhizobium japonicum]
MRAIAIDADEHRRCGPLADEMHLCRGQMFAGRLGWRVNVGHSRGRARDEYDAIDPVLLHRSDLASCTRLITTTAPSVLSHTFAIESSQVVVDTGGKRKGGQPLRRTTLTRFARIIESTSKGDAIATATDLGADASCNWRAGRSPVLGAWSGSERP